WRIRHKLILGGALVLAVMALLLVGTLNGLLSHRATMRIFDGKLPELEKADALRAQVRSLSARTNEGGQQLKLISDNLKSARAALEEYRAQLQETIRHDPAQRDQE